MFPDAFVWAFYIHTGKMLINHVLDMSLLRSIEVASRHKLATSEPFDIQRWPPKPPS